MALCECCVCVCYSGFCLAAAVCGGVLWVNILLMLLILLLLLIPGTETATATSTAGMFFSAVERVGWCGVLHLCTERQAT